LREKDLTFELVKTLSWPTVTTQHYHLQWGK